MTLTFAPDGKTLAAGYKAADGGGSVTVWDVANRKLLTENSFVVQEGEVFSVALSVDNSFLVVGYGMNGAGRGMRIDYESEGLIPKRGDGVCMVG